MVLYFVPLVFRSLQDEGLFLLFQVWPLSCHHYTKQLVLHSLRCDHEVQKCYLNSQCEFGQIIVTGQFLIRLHMLNYFYAVHDWCHLILISAAVHKGAKQFILYNKNTGFIYHIYNHITWKKHWILCPQFTLISKKHKSDLLTVAQINNLKGFIHLQ